MKKSIIINADDFGYDEDSVQTTIDCFNIGAITSASVMPLMPASTMAFEYAKKNSQFSFGLHLTFTTDTFERPVSKPELIPSLVTKEGFFHASNKLRIMALTGRLPIDQIKTEIASQIEMVLDNGVSISHIDSHGHMHKFKPFIEALKGVLPRYAITRVRNVQNQYVNKPLLSPTFWMGGVWRNRIMNNFRTTQNFFMSTGVHDKYWVDEILGKDFRGVLEIGVHPGSSNHEDSWRNIEFINIKNFIEQYQKNKINLLNWKNI